MIHQSGTESPPENHTGTSQQVLFPGNDSRAFNASSTFFTETYRSGKPRLAVLAKDKVPGKRRAVEFSQGTQGILAARAAGGIQRHRPVALRTFVQIGRIKAVGVKTSISPGSRHIQRPATTITESSPLDPLPAAMRAKDCRCPDFDRLASGTAALGGIIGSPALRACHPLMCRCIHFRASRIPNDRNPSRVETMRPSVRLLK